MAAAASAEAKPRDFEAMLAGALRDAVVTGLIAFVIFGIMVGVRTEAPQQALTLRFDFWLALQLTAAVTIGRFLIDLLIWRGALPIGDIVKSDGYRTFLAAARLALAAFYALGGAFFFAGGVRAAFVNGVASLAPAESWSRGLNVFADLLSILIMGLFVIATAMAACRALRLGWRRLMGGEGAEAPLRRAATANIMQEFAPALLLVALVLPVIVAGPLQRYAIDTAIQVLTYIMLGWGLNIVVGLAGLLDLGYVAFYAVGAYSYALIATQLGWSFWLCLPLAGLFAAFFGIILGFPVLRLRGDYLAIVTLAFGEIIRVVLINWQSVTGGANGILNIPRLSFFGLPFDRGAPGGFHETFGIEFSPIHRILFLYYVILALALLTNYVANRLRRLPLGRAWEALREDEIACRALGINTVTTKLSAFAIGALFAGFAGSFFAARQGSIAPASFTFHESALVLAIVVLGGLGSQMGVVIAAVALIGGSEFFRDLAEYRMLLFGLLMVALMTWRPRGLIATRAPSVVLKQRKAIAADHVGEGKG